MKKIFVILSLVFIVSVVVIFSKGEEKDFKNYTNKNADKLSMMLETEAGTGNYEEVTRDAWPTEGYTFNTTLSKCENGGQISWDDEKKIVIMNGDSKDMCYVYFDVDNTFATYIKSLYTGTQGDNNLYLHDDSLENGANDGSYRYSGSSETTNNFVCFGYDSKNGECPTDNLYRIIGVFGDNVKLIKYDYATSDLLGTDGDYYIDDTWSGASYSTYKHFLNTINTYYWNYKANTKINSGKGSNDWSTSLLNKINLNTNYLTNIGDWQYKIVTTIWKVGGNTYTNIYNTTVSNAYKNEITSPVADTTVSAKVGLMYVSDYGYAALPSAWTTNLSSYNGAGVTAKNWMYMGVWDWTITPHTNLVYSVFNVRDNGAVDYHYAYHNRPVRPVFFLEKSVDYVSGTGTSSNPYIIN